MTIQDEMQGEFPRYIHTPYFIYLNDGWPFLLLITVLTSQRNLLLLVFHHYIDIYHVITRAISLYRTSYSYVAHARAEVNGISARVKGEEVSSFLYAMLWLGQYAPDQSTYTPVYIASTELPSSYTSGSMHVCTAMSIFFSSNVLYLL